MIYPNPRHLRAFVTIAKTGSLGGAAQLMHMGQPALSQALAKLESLAGTTLMERTTRSLTLTPAGQAFLVDAQRVLRENERLLDNAQQWAQAQRGRLALLTIPSVAHRLLPAIVRSFRADHPDVDISVHDHADPVLRQQLARGEGDLAILTTQARPDPAELTLPLLRDHFRFVCRADHRLAQEAAVDLAQLAGEQLILLRPGTLFREHADAMLRKVRLQHAPVEVDQPATLVGMVEAGLGVSLLPGLGCPPAALQTVVSRPLAVPVWREIVFSRPPGRPCSPVAQAFVRLSLQRLAQHTDLPEGAVLLTPKEARLARFLS